MDGSNAGEMTERTYAVADRGKGDLIIMLWHLQIFLCLKDQHEMPRHWYSLCHFDLTVGIWEQCEAGLDMLLVVP